MEGIAGLPVVDHHCHLSRAGDGVQAAGRFRAAGGTHLFLATQNYDSAVPSDVDAYQRQFEETERLGAEVHAETGVVVYLVVAPFPVDLVQATERIGLPAALDVHERALDLAGRWVREGRAVALGEVGWPHFPLSPELDEAARSAFRHALAVARDAGCPAVVHSPDLDAEGWRALEAEARRAGLPPHRLIKHYARHRRPEGTGESVVPSYLARRELVPLVLPDPGPWFLETDYLDDPTRPGAVLDLATIPRRAQAIARQGTAAAEQLAVPFERAVAASYGFTPSLGGP